MIKHEQIGVGLKTYAVFYTSLNTLCSLLKPVSVPNTVAVSLSSWAKPRTRPLKPICIQSDTSHLSLHPLSSCTCVAHDHEGEILLLVNLGHLETCLSWCLNGALDRWMDGWVGGWWRERPEEVTWAGME